MLDRHNSAVSVLSSTSEFCRICHCDSSCGELISPCYCSGSLRWVHQICLQHWIRASSCKSCELCRYPFSMRTRLRPICQWELLPMSASEKRRLFCSALFHSVALGCVIWSLYVLIDRTIDELYQSELEWQFWTKIVVEAIGCIGAGILFYVWGKIYFCLLRKWISFNRTFVIVDSAPVPIKQKPSSLTNLHLMTSAPTSVYHHHHRGSSGGGIPDPELGLGNGGSGDSESEKGNMEARALLLPPINYSSPSHDPNSDPSEPYVMLQQP